MIPGAYEVQSWDRYAAMANNPVRFTDSSGHKVDPGGETWGMDSDKDNYKDAGKEKQVTFDGSLGENKESNDLEDQNKGIVTSGQKIGLVATGFVMIVGFTVAEITLGVIGIAALNMGPMGVLLDVGIVIPMELFLLDCELAIARYTYDVVTTGSKEGKKVELYLFSFLQ